ncbi:MAG TPA: thymidine phosphorylase [Planctomycetota bacterium]|nr:thymidine phosphorylase [Planctomycetota bacterium]
MPTHSVPELIKRKRDGGTFTAEEIEHLVYGVARGSVADYQAAALCMAIFFRGLDDAELVAWTAAMRDSGRTLDWKGAAGARVDKHSTGGVGDKISLPLAPIAAACGVGVPMLSGRGLGHTGGTLDKLAAIPGFRTDLSIDEMIAGVRAIGVAMGGQTADLAPADGMLYALRDVTGTVESIPLIVSSILAKKLAERLDGLVMDVKVGSGAFMKSHADAHTLAKRLVATARLDGCPTVALITAMDAPLGEACGNANEVRESIDVLRGGGPADVVELTLALAAEMLVLGRAAATLDDARAKARAAIASGAALERFQQLVERQGGDARVIDEPERLALASKRATVTAHGDGFLARVDAHAVGLAVVALGGGRAKKSDDVDPSVGVWVKRKPGDRVRHGDVVFEAAYRDDARWAAARHLLEKAIELAPQAPPPAPLILERIA